MGAACSLATEAWMVKGQDSGLWCKTDKKLQRKYLNYRSSRLQNYMNWIESKEHLRDFLIYDKSWRIINGPQVWRGANIPIFRRGRIETRETLVSLISVWGKILEQLVKLSVCKHLIQLLGETRMDLSRRNPPRLILSISYWVTSLVGHGSALDTLHDGFLACILGNFWIQTQPWVFSISCSSFTWLLSTITLPLGPSLHYMYRDFGEESDKSLPYI